MEITANLNFYSEVDCIRQII